MTGLVIILNFYLHLDYDDVDKTVTGQVKKKRDFFRRDISFVLQGKLLVH